MPEYYDNRPTSRIDSPLADVLASAPGSCPLTFARVSPASSAQRSDKVIVDFDEANSARRHACLHAVVVPLAKTATTITERQAFEFEIRQ